MKFNVLIASLIVIALTTWMVVGSLLAQKKSDEEHVSEEEKALATVRTRESKAEDFSAELVLRGKTEAARASVLKAEVGGQVLEIVAERGSVVKKGDTILRLDLQNLPEHVEAAEALVTLREMEHAAAEKLQSTGYQSETRLAEASSALASAINQLAQARIALENTEVKAPFEGVFNERLVEVGEFVTMGDPVASFLELNPMIVTAQATEREIQKLKTGDKARAEIDHSRVEGTIRYISKSANPSVRTYTVELAFENPDYAFQAGLTADIFAPTESQKAHKVSPAILFLSANSDGNLGIKTVDDNNIVVFHKTTIIGNDNDGLWVSGLPNEARIITVGQGFVKPGVEVKAVEESTIN